MREDINIHPAAKAEFHDLIRHFAAVDYTGDIALAFESAFSHHLDAILAAPLHYNLRRRPTRRVNLVPQFRETYIAYMLWREKIVILAVGHAKRRPYYWRNRIGESRELF